MTTEAADAVAIARGVIDTAVRHLAAADDPEAEQVVAYDVAHAAAAVENASAVLAYGEKGDVENRIAKAFAAEAIHDVATRLLGREAAWGVELSMIHGALPFVREHRSAEFLAGLAGEEGPRHLDGDFEMVQDSFRRFAEDKVRPVAEHIHRENADIPEDIISGLAELGTFGLSIPEEYGGFATPGEGEYMAMVVSTEELSRGSLGVAGSLITRPEILARALVTGATEEQKQEWLPKLASGEVMAAVAVTEPDFGSDSGGVKTAATRDGDDYVITGVKTWCTFAGRADALMLQARTDPDRSLKHRGLSLFIVPKERAPGHSFQFDQPGGGRMEGRAIDTIGYRGMHSYEVSFDGWRVPAANLIGGEAGIGRGFYLCMAGFENGRLQTAGRAVGVMQAAYEAARDYARDRSVFGQPLAQFELTQVKLTRMAVVIQAARQFMYSVARLMAKGQGTMEAAMVKAYVCRAAEWVTREAMQVHGGMGYAEEFPVSRYYVDARVLSIFEGADEVLALSVIFRNLIKNAR
ncbi:MAG TPA: acyl-CoA dehydrogenase family protein [Acidimicrobiales bacterium]|nr:acyl-CoA dehydrogenase family protein [Acidimicrobiales bacterium]